MRTDKYFVEKGRIKERVAARLSRVVLTTQERLGRAWLNFGKTFGFAC